DPLDDEGLATAAATALDIGQLGDPALKTDAMGQAASMVSAFPGVRSALFDFQRDFASRPPGAVLDGRDIGTVICPGAESKIFVVACAEVRAHRRAQEIAAGGEPVDEAVVLEDIRRRDARDQNRAVAPTRAAPDAHLLDTTHLDIDAAFRAAV